MDIVGQLRARIGAVPRAFARRETRRFLHAAKTCRTTMYSPEEMTRREKAAKRKKLRAAEARKKARAAGKKPVKAKRVKKSR